MPEPRRDKAYTQNTICMKDISHDVHILSFQKPELKSVLPVTWIFDHRRLVLCCAIIIMVLLSDDGYS